MLVSGAYQNVSALACGSTTRSRFQRQAWVHHPGDALHGSPLFRPRTGTVHVELVAALPETQPGGWSRPNVYWVPSVVVIRQYSPPLAPLAAPVRCSTRAPLSLRRCQAPVASSLTISVACPFSSTVALS